MHFRAISLLIVISGSASTAFADVVHDESADGDISNDRLNPTAAALTLGTNSLFATSMQGDREYIALTIPAGLELSSIIQVSYVGMDETAFAAVQAGAQMTVDPDSFDPTGLLGWVHFGPTNFTDGSDILPTMGTGPGADGFAPPLPAGTYTFWLQQAGSDPVTYQLDFIVTPAPGTAALLGLAGLVTLRRRR